MLLVLLAACGEGSSNVVNVDPCAGDIGLLGGPLTEGAVTYTICGDFTSVVAEVPVYDAQGLIIAYADVFWHETDSPYFPEPVVENEHYTVSFEDIDGGRSYTVYGLEPRQEVFFRISSAYGENHWSIGHHQYVVREDYVERVEEGRCASGIGLLQSRLVQGAVAYTVCGDLPNVKVMAKSRESDGEYGPYANAFDANQYGLNAETGYLAVAEDIVGGRTYTVSGHTPDQVVRFSSHGGDVVEGRHRRDFWTIRPVVEEAPTAIAD